MIVSGADNVINPSTVKLKIVSKDKQTGKPKKTRQGQLYTEYATQKDFGELGLLSKLVLDWTELWTTHRENLAILTQAGKRAVNSLK